MSVSWWREAELWYWKSRRCQLCWSFTTMAWISSGDSPIYHTTGSATNDVPSLKVYLDHSSFWFEYAVDKDATTVHTCFYFGSKSLLKKIDLGELFLLRGKLVVGQLPQCVEFKEWWLHTCFIFFLARQLCNLSFFGKLQSLMFHSFILTEYWWGLLVDGRGEVVIFGSE